MLYLGNLERSAAQLREDILCLFVSREVCRRLIKTACRHVHGEQCERERKRLEKTTAARCRLEMNAERRKMSRTSRNQAIHLDA